MLGLKAAQTSKPDPLRLLLPPVPPRWRKLCVIAGRESVVRLGRNVSFTFHHDVSYGVASRLFGCLIPQRWQIQFRKKILTAAHQHRRYG